MGPFSHGRRGELARLLSNFEPIPEGDIFCLKTCNVQQSLDFVAAVALFLLEQLEMMKELDDAVVGLSDLNSVRFLLVD